MRWKAPLLLKPNLFVLVHAGTGEPYAARLSLRKVSRLLAVAGVSFLITGAGTLLFFRELELNRKLQDRLLELETREQLSRLPLPMPATPSGKPVTPVSAADRTLADSTMKAPTEATDSESGNAGLSPASTRIADLATECSPEECRVRFSLVPASTGTAQGQLLVVLEAEVPRIGAGNPTTQVRRRYYMYPGNDARDELAQRDLASIAKKQFRFSRALQTTASFKIAKLQRPLAVNLYLFDRDGVLQHHERKVIETKEE